jgi:hypothetical protein
MMNLLAMINMESLGLPWMITLTFPDAFPKDADAVKSMLHRFSLAFLRAYGKNPVIWREEFKERRSGSHKGEWAPHLHLLEWGVEPTGEELAWLSRTWFTIVASGDEKHLRAGTRWEPIANWPHLLCYVSKYVAKLEEFADIPEPGRAWGVWNRELLPIKLVSEEIPDDRFFALRRVLRKYIERRSGRKVRHAGCWTGLTCYLREATGVRLVDWAWGGASEASDKRQGHPGMGGGEIVESRAS